MYILDSLHILDGAEEKVAGQLAFLLLNLAFFPLYFSSKITLKSFVRRRVYFRGTESTFALENENRHFADV